MTTDSVDDVARKEAVWMTRCGVGKRYARPRREELGQREVIEAYCDSMMQSCQDGLGLLLYGGVGSGKTMALAYIISRARVGLPLSAVVVMTTMQHLLDRLYQDPANLQALVQPALLCIDDLGGEYRADWGFGRFEGLVEERYAQMKSICVSTSLTPAALAEAEVLARVMSRWGEVLAPVVLPERDRRQPREGMLASLRKAGVME